MKKLLILLPFMMLFGLSCKENKGHKLLGEWQETRIINPQMDETLQNQVYFSDTVGARTNALQNKQLYGTDNIDSFRKTIKANIDSFRKHQFLAIEATKFVFLKDSLIAIHSDDGIDTGKWYLDDDGALILDELANGVSKGKARMEILELSDTMLKLQFTEKYLSSTAIFKPVKK